MGISFRPTDILIPHGIDLTKWSVIACDQFTSEPEYWLKTKEIVGNAPSTLNLIFPEIYLSEGEKHIKDINNKMCEYIDAGLFKEYKNSLIFVKRRLPSGKIRYGLVGAIDLEDYSFEKGSQSNVRATEGTVLERIPPRVEIRKNAPLEFPHIMILIDDPGKTVIEPLSDDKDSLEKLYDFELMQNGGHIEGYLVKASEADAITQALENLSSPDAFYERYGLSNIPIMTFAVGDGNHSLATAKACWKKIKTTLSEKEIQSHPARFALVELVNLHDDSLEFEPIHRVIFDVDPQSVYDSLLAFYPDASETDNGGKMIECVFQNTKREIWIMDETNNLAAGTLQNFIDAYLKDNPGSVDYIHGENSVLELCKNKNNIGFLLPSMKKSDLFKTVISDGALPRKTFSMGEANEKRYYLEGKRIK